MLKNLARGNIKFEKPPGKNAKKITAAGFVKDINKLGELLADDFVNNVVRSELDKRYSPKKVKRLMKCLKIEGTTMSVQKTDDVDDISYQELWKVIEFGRTDKGQLPNPILRDEFPKHKKVMKENLKKLLTGK